MNQARNYREYRTIDKDAWGPGPWQDEPDKIQWIDEATGFDCLMVRHPTSGHWCGYAGIAAGHPLHGIDYGNAPNVGDVHGGLTFSDFCAHTDDESRHVCHVPEPGRPDRVWWFGFDCAHLYDLAPARHAREVATGWADPQDAYRARHYVERQVAALAAELSAAAQVAV